MKLKKEFEDFYKEIRIDCETHALKEKREVLENDIKTKLPGILGDHSISISRSDIRMINQKNYKYKWVSFIQNETERGRLKRGFDKFESVLAFQTTFPLTLTRSSSSG